MTAFQPDRPAEEGDQPQAWPAPEPLFPAAAREPSSGALRPTAPEPATSEAPTPAGPTPAGPTPAGPTPAARKRSVWRGAGAVLQLFLFVLFAAAFLAAVVVGGFLLLTMALRAAAT